MPIGHGKLGLAVRRRLGRTLRPRDFDQAIVLPRSWKAALVPYFARVPVRTGFRGEWRYGLINDMRAFDPDKLSRTVQRFVALGLDADDKDLPEILPPRLTVDSRAALHLLERLGLPRDREVAALIPGAEYGAAKRWPAERYGELAARLVADGMAVWILGSGKEFPLAEQVRATARSAAVVNLCGRTTLTEAIDLLAAARVAISNDSGLMHVAAAVGTHVVALYGSSTPLMTPPLTDRSSILYLGLECSPCFARECPLGHLDCLRNIDVASVHATVEAAIGPRPGADPRLPRRAERQ
jgi:lipopolysaccharide heptosyltransferase II